MPTKDIYGRPLVIDGTFPDGRPSCASIFDAALESTDATSFFAALEDGSFWDGPWSTELTSMPRDVRMLWLIDWLFYTRRRPRALARHDSFAAYGVDFERWLIEIGANQTARYIRELLDMYPGGVPFDDEAERDRLMTAAEKADPQLWSTLVARYPMLEDELAVSLRAVFQARGAAIATECDALRARFAEPLPLQLVDVVSAPSSDVEFLAALTGWLNAPAGRPELGFEKQPDTGRMLWVLGALSTSVAVSGMVHFLHSVGVGRYFPKLAGWAKTIGATTTVAYVKAASTELKRLNGGKLPPMADQPRIAVIHELEEQDEAAGGRGLFVELDETYGVLVVAELATKLRGYVKAHLKEVEKRVSEGR